MARRRGGTLPDGWVGPWWLEAAAGDDDRIATAVGTVDTGAAALVDPRGLVAPVAGGWSLDWWVGAEDGWHLPSREPATRVRQALVDGGPVVETTMRVPGGEVVHRCYGARAAGGPAVVVEVENRSHVPVAVALAVRPYDLQGTATLRRAALRERVVEVDGAPAVVFGKAPAFAAAAGGRDVADEVLAGTQQRPETVTEARHRRGLASLAAVFPLPHTAVLRVAVADHEVDVAALPDAAAVARGWDAHLAGAMRVVVPDETLQAAVDAARAALVLHADERALDDPIVMGALERWGFRAVAAAVADQRGYRLEPGFAVPDGALGLRPDVLARVAELQRSASTTWTWPAGGAHPGRAAAELLLLVRAALLAEGRDGLGLWPLVDDAWLGQGVEVHDAPTGAGPLSYAVRWHGARPAVLWDGPGGVTVRAPGLDPSWSTSEPRGEALLAPVEPAGGLPKVYGEVEVGARVDEADGSFS